MHESFICGQIIKEAESHGKVKKVVIEVGDLGHLPAEELEETMKTMVPWQIEIIKKKATVECTCGYKGEPHILEKGHASTVFECPRCKKVPKILDGDQIILKEVEVE